MSEYVNKKILFIAPKFYNYHNDIISYLEQKGAIVTFFAEDIYTPLYRFSNKLFPKFATYIKNQYTNSILENLDTNIYDIVFVIRGGVLSTKVLEAIKLKLPKAKFVMYQWDSNNQSNYKDKIKYFDIVKTFDQEDALKYKLEYLPLFYTKQYQDVLENQQIKEYDLVFYGAYHSDRLDIIKYFDKKFKDNNLVFKYHLYITKMALFRLVLKGQIKFKDLKYLKTYAVTTNEILDVYKKSTSVLDIELNIQNGLTMRTFETLGSGLKLVTTNQNIKNEDFYDENIIMVIDRNNLNVDIGFFINNLKFNLDFKEYLFDSWLNKIFIKF